MRPLRRLLRIFNFINGWINYLLDWGLFTLVFDELSAVVFSASCFSTSFRPLFSASCFRRVVFGELFSTSFPRFIFHHSSIGGHFGGRNSFCGGHRWPTGGWWWPPMGYRWGSVGHRWTIGGLRCAVDERSPKVGYPSWNCGKFLQAQAYMHCSSSIIFGKS